MDSLVPVYQVKVPFEHQQILAASIAKSGLFGIKTTDQALVLMALCESEGLHPIRAAQDYHIIQGRPALRTDAMLARFQAAGGKVQWHDYTDDVVSATFSHPAGGSLKVDWTLERAKAAGLSGKDVWRQYPRAMLRARVISEGIRTVYPGVLSGMYTPEEVRDMAPEAASEPPPVSVVLPPPFDAAAADAEIAAFTDINEMRAWLALERRRYGWHAGDATYEALKAACAERAKVIRQAAMESVLEAATLEAAPEATDE